MIMVNKFLLRLYSVDEGSKVRGSIPTNPNVRSDVEVYVADCQLNSNAEVVKVLAKIHIETASLHTSRIWTMYEASHMRGSAYRSRPLWPKFAFFSLFANHGTRMPGRLPALNPHPSPCSRTRGGKKQKACISACSYLYWIWRYSEIHVRQGT